MICSNCGAPTQPNAACPCSSAVFNFVNFASEIYRERATAHSTPYLLPALYGGELGPGEEYEVLFVLQDPSVRYTEDRWKPCQTVTDAIDQHRRIFRSWAFEPGSNQGILFGKFNMHPVRRKNRRSLYQRFYVTDVWKDGVRQDYWRRKLRTELREVKASLILFVGGDPWKEGSKILDGAGGERMIDQIKHPGVRHYGVTEAEYRNQVDELWHRITAKGY